MTMVEDLIGPPRWVWRLLAASVMIVLLAVTTMAGVMAYTLAHRFEHVEQAANLRNCRGAISGAYDALRDRRDDLLSQMVATAAGGDQTGASALGGPLATATAAVENLPALEVAVARGVTIDGVRFAACTG